MADLLLNWARPKRRTALLALLASVFLVLPGIASATPSEDDIRRAQAAEEAAKLSVAQIEVELANVTAAAEEALRQSQIAAEEYNAAKLELEAATDTALRARQDADAAAKAFDDGRKAIATVAQTAYREGGNALDSLAPYLDSDGLRSVEVKRAGIQSFSTSASTRIQEVSALEQVAQVMEAAAESALEAQEAATAEVEERLQAAEAAAENAAAEQQRTEIQRQALVEELAQRQNTTAALIEERQAALEAARQAAIAEELRRQAEEAARQAEIQRQQAAEAASQQQAAAPAAPAAPSYQAPAVSTGGSGSPSAAALGAIAHAKTLLGAPYVWGGEGPGYDCSGLVTVAYRSQGIYLGHYTGTQYNSGTRVPFSQAIPGDLVFWSTGGTPYHVAIYLGDGQIIEAANYGVPLRISPIHTWSNVMPYVVRVA